MNDFTLKDLGGAQPIGGGTSPLAEVLEKDDPGTLESVFRFLSRPAYVFRSLITGDLEGTVRNSLQFMNEIPTGGFIDPDFTVTSFMDGFLGLFGLGDSLPSDLTTKAQRPEGSDVLYRWGGPHPASLNWGERFAVDLVGGGLTDPLSLVGGMGKGVAEGSLTGLTRSMAQEAVLHGLEGAGPTAARDLAEGAAPELIRMAQRGMEGQAVGGNRVAQASRGSSGRAAENLLFQSIDPATGLLDRWSTNTLAHTDLTEDASIANALLNGDAPVILTDGNLPGRLAAIDPAANARLSEGLVSRQFVQRPIATGGTIYHTPRTQWRADALAHLIEQPLADAEPATAIARERDLLRLRGVAEASITDRLTAGFPDQAQTVERLMNEDRTWSRLGAEVPGEVLDAGIKALRARYGMEDPAAIYGWFGERTKLMDNFWSRAAGATLPGAVYQRSPQAVKDTLGAFWTTGVRTLFNKHYPGDLPKGAEAVTRFLSGKMRENNIRNQDRAGTAFGPFSKPSRDALAQELDAGQGEMDLWGSTNQRPGLPGRSLSYVGEPQPGITPVEQRATLAFNAAEARVTAAGDVAGAGHTRLYEAGVNSTRANSNLNRADIVVDQAAQDLGHVEPIHEALLQEAVNLVGIPEADQVEELAAGGDYPSVLRNHEDPFSQALAAANDLGNQNGREGQRLSRAARELERAKAEAPDLYTRAVTAWEQIKDRPGNIAMLIRDTGLGIGERDILRFLAQSRVDEEATTGLKHILDQRLGEAVRARPSLAPTMNSMVDRLMDSAGQVASARGRWEQATHNATTRFQRQGIAEEAYGFASHEAEQLDSFFDSESILTSAEAERFSAGRVMKNVIERATARVAEIEGRPPGEIRPLVEAAYDTFQRGMEEIPPAMAHRLQIWAHAVGNPFYVPHQAEARIWELLNEGSLDRNAARAIEDVFAGRRQWTTSEFQSRLRGLADRFHIPIEHLDEVQKWDIWELYLRRMHGFERTKFRAQAMDYAERMAAAHNLPDRRFTTYVRGLFASAGTRTDVVSKLLGGGTFEIRRPAEGTTLARLLVNADNELLRTKVGTDREGNEVLRMEWAGLNRIYKPLLTSFPTNPKFHVRNTLSAVMMGALDPDIGWSGAKQTWDLVRNSAIVRRFLKLDYTPDEVTEAVRFLTDPDPVVRAGALGRLRETGRMVGRYTWDETAGILRRSLGGKVSQADLFSGLDPSFFQGYRLAEEASPANPTAVQASLRWFQNLVDLGQNMANQVEHRFRVSATLELLAKGVPADEAVARVQKAFVDYDVNSQTERWIRDVFPFARFTIGSTAWLKPMLERPQVLGMLARARFSGQGMMESEPGGGAFLPERAKGSVALPLPWRDADRNLQFLIGLGLPQETAMGILSMTEPEGLRKVVGGGLHPVLRLPVEYGLGRSFYFDEDWGTYRRASPLMRPIATSATDANGKTRYEIPGAWNEILNASPLAVQEGNLNKVLDERWGVLTKALNVLTGVRTLSVDMKRELRERMVSYLKDKVQSGQAGELNVFFAKGEAVPEDLKVVLREYADTRAKPKSK